MSPDIRVKKIGFDALEIFPVFIDYDMENRKCRGLSAKIDLFSYGTLSAVIDKMPDESLAFAITDGILIRKERLMFTNGFFLFDFKYLSEHPDVLAKKINDLGLPVAYVEHSERFDVAALVSGIGECKVELLEFGNA